MCLSTPLMLTSGEIETKVVGYFGIYSSNEGGAQFISMAKMSTAPVAISGSMDIQFPVMPTKMSFTSIL